MCLGGFQYSPSSRPTFYCTPGTKFPMPRLSAVVLLAQDHIHMPRIVVEQRRPQRRKITLPVNFPSRLCERERAKRETAKARFPEGALLL
jgi:hypothetical protein